MKPATNELICFPTSTTAEQSYFVVSFERSFTYSNFRAYTVNVGEMGWAAFFSSCLVYFDAILEMRVGEFLKT
jgi:hypothetical protein